MTVTEQQQAPAAPSTADVRLDHVTKRFEDVAAVDDLSLEIERGSFFALLGPSGCGKTTTLRMIGGFEQPTEGTIYLGDEPVSGRPPYKRDVNTVFQSYALFPHLTIFENVAFGLRRRGVRGGDVRGRVESILDLVGLEGLGKRKPRQLSGGQQQRVALARALVMNPRVLLLDEPLGALDLKLRKEMQIELKRIQSQVGITFIYVTHDQEEALSMSDRVAVMSNGVIEQLDEPRAIYDRPLTPFVADFIGDMNFVDGDVVEAGDGGFAVDAGAGVVIRGRGDAQRGKRVRIGIRPERMAAHPGQPDGTANKAAGEVVTKMYLGDQVQVVATLANGTSVVVREQRASADPALDTIHPGDQIAVSWDEAAPHMLGDADTTEATA